MEATESPLDVLSRAATMVQDSSSAEYDDRSHATKELPTTRWRRERRCKDRLGEYSKLQQNKATHDITSETSTDTLSTRTGDTPLDMTTSRNCKPPPPYSQSVTGYPRPSVITCAPPATTAWGEHHRNTNKDDSARQGHRRELLSGMCDPVIDEHFRRSLGKDYNSLFSTDDSTTNNNNDSNSNSSSSITVTGLSVDDHFAKALGETWVKLQGQNNGTAATVPKDKKSAASTATVSLSVAKKDSTPTPTTAVPTTTTTLRRGLVSI